MRKTTLALLVTLSAGCATTRTGTDGKPLPRYGAARAVLGALLVGSAALAVGSAVRGQRLEDDLRDDLGAGGLTGSQFAARDRQGQRWNRIARASTFASGLSLLGLGVVWEMSIGNDLRFGPLPPAPEGGADAAPVPPPPPLAAPAR